MSLLSIILTVLGLSLFEIVSSIDNAIINAEVLSTMHEKAKKFFLSWGIIIAVFVVRGLLPFLIVWATIPSLGPIGAITATFSNDPQIAATIEESSGILLIGGGTFLIFLFFHWLFLQPKEYGLFTERFFHKQGVWFFAIVSILLSLIVYFAVNINPMLALGAVIGSTAFFITHGFQEYAEKGEESLVGKKGMLASLSRSGPTSTSPRLSTLGGPDLSKILYLEVIDATFSIDGVVGAFAFTFAVPLIFLGNSIGAIVLRSLTISNIERVKKYKYLKNGAMYSILVLGIIMLSESFGLNIPSWISPVTTFIIIGYFFNKSRTQLNFKL